MDNAGFMMFDARNIIKFHQCLLKICFKFHQCFIKFHQCVCVCLICFKIKAARPVDFLVEITTATVLYI
jgi:hypothetical protein